MSQSEDLPRMNRRSFARRVAAASASGLPLLVPRRAEANVGASRVRVWAEGTAPRSIYPDDVDGALGEYLRRQAGFHVQQARLGDHQAGLSDRALDATDVLVWWGRLRHDDLPDDRARAIADRVRAGQLGFVALHASCCSKPFRELMGTPCEPARWREDGRPERVTVEAPGHEIARGIAPFVIPRTAMYAEPFPIPKPETLVFRSKFEGGETFRAA